MGKQRVLLTGGAGYLAGFIAEAMREHNEVTLMDRVAPVASDPRADLTFIQADVTDYGQVNAACEDRDLVVHTIALVRERFGVSAGIHCDVMVKGTWNVAQACVDQGVARLINISSISAAGSPAVIPSRPEQGGKLTERDLFYGLAKTLGEGVGRAYHDAHGLEVIHLRPGVIAGDGLNPDPTTLAEPLDHWFTYVDPRDVAHAVSQAQQAAIRYGTYNIVAGRADTMFDYSAAEEELGYAPQHNWPDIPEKGFAS